MNSCSNESRPGAAAAKGYLFCDCIMGDIGPGALYWVEKACG